ncbi:unnamed protein product [Lymnaea stagnalis]|uniref:Angiomotin C-terminal domain-containing protein n=1 Tax=Lymnaea stagnalis TaxID=6523 RepID=A0AAV2HAQ8_LYMST
MMVVEQLDETIYENSRTGLLPQLRWIDMQNYRDPPPYPGHSKQVYSNQPGFRQSFSGSETSTDVSLSSTENLATSQRQEPQGEETQTSFNYHLDVGSSDGSSYSILERLGMPPGALDSVGKLSPSNSANILSTSSSYYQDRSYLRHLNELNSGSNSLGLSSAPLPLYSQGHLTVPSWQLSNNTQAHRQGEFTSQQQSDGAALSGEYNSSLSRTAADSSYSSSASTHTIINRGGVGEYSSSYHLSSNRNGSNGDTGFSSALSSSSSNQYLSPRVPPVSTYHHPHPYVNTHWTVGSGDSSSSSHSSITAFTQSSGAPLSHSSASSNSGTGAAPHFGHAQSLSYLTNLPPPPEYPGSKNMVNSLSASEKAAEIRSCRSYETMDKVNVQRSHPDLRMCSSSPGIYMQDAKYLSQSPHRSANNSADECDQATIAAKASQMVEMLTHENRALREELSSYANKVAKLQKFEMEIQKVHESHRALVKSGEKREGLWLAMRRKLEEKIQSLESQKEDNGMNSGRPAVNLTESEYKIKLAEKDAKISKLLSQNQEMSLSRDELEGENTQLTLTSTELRAHVEIFENALLAAQTKVLTLEEEKHVYLDKIEQLQKAITALQAASEKQEKKEREMRALLEKELEMYKAQEKGGAQRKPDLGKDEVKGTSTLRKMLDEKDARILQLETELATMEQKYIKETTMRQLISGDSSQTSKEVRLSALEKASSERDQVKTEKFKHIEELHNSHRTVAELEAKVKQLQSQLVEKEAILKVFQRAPLAMARSSSLHALCHSPLHSPRPSLLSSHAWPGTGQSVESSASTSASYRDFATIRHMKTGSAGAVELGRKMSMEEDLLTKVQNLNTEIKSDSEDEVKLWHV